MNVLISQRIIVDSCNQKVDSLEKAYVEYFDSFGIDTFPVTNFIKHPRSYFKKVRYQGLILSGGGIIAPNRERYKTESELIKVALLHKLPILGICHGMQMLNHYFGGKITKNIHDNAAVLRSPKVGHSVSIEKPIFGLRGVYKVNHYHLDGVRRNQVTKNFDIFAVDKDLDIIEGIVHKSLPIVGLQWHPERKGSEKKLNETIIKNIFSIDRR